MPVRRRRQITKPGLLAQPRSLDQEEFSKSVRLSKNAAAQEEERNQADTDQARGNRLRNRAAVALGSTNYATGYINARRRPKGEDSTCYRGICGYTSDGKVEGRGLVDERIMGVITSN